MKEVGISSDRNCSSSFEAQISKLYSRSLFLRKDELKALQRSARIIDQQAARQFVLHTTLTAEANQTLANIIIKFRVNQASRQDDAETLAALRKKVLEYRKSVLSSWLVTKAFKKLFRDDIEKKHKRIAASYAYDRLFLLRWLKSTTENPENIIRSKRDVTKATRLRSFTLCQNPSTSKYLR